MGSPLQFEYKQLENTLKTYDPRTEQHILKEMIQNKIFIKGNSSQEYGKAGELVYEEAYSRIKDNCNLQL